MHNRLQETLQPVQMQEPQNCMAKGSTKIHATLYTLTAGSSDANHQQHLDPRGP